MFCYSSLAALDFGAGIIFDLADIGTYFHFVHHQQMVSLVKHLSCHIPEMLFASEILLYWVIIS